MLRVRLRDHLPSVVAEDTTAHLPRMRHRRYHAEGAPPQAGARATSMIDRSTDNLLRPEEVITITRLSRTTIYRKVRAGTFPRPVAISAGLSAWYESDINRWKSDPAGWSQSGN